MDVPWCARNISSKQEETEFTIQISNINEIKFYLYNANRDTQRDFCVYSAIKKKQKKKEFEEKEIKNPLFNKIKKMRKISSQIVLLRWN